MQSLAQGCHVAGPGLHRLLIVRQIPDLEKTLKDIDPLNPVSKSIFETGSNQIGAQSNVTWFRRFDADATFSAGAITALKETCS